MKNYFWDSSAIVKLLHREEHSEFYKNIFSTTNSRHFASLISKIEINGAIRRNLSEKRRKTRLEKALLNLDYGKMIIDFQSVLYNSLKSKLYRSIFFLNLGREIMDEAESMVLSHDIRTLDAIILATLVNLMDEIKNIELVSSDHRQTSVAQRLGIKTLQPQERD